MFVSEPESYDGIFFMCDILGFGNLIKDNSCLDVGKKLMQDMLETLKTTEKKFIDSEVEHTTLWDKIKDEWSYDYKLNYYTFSDTIMIYPNINYNISSACYMVSFKILLEVVIILYNYFLLYHNLLIRGAMVHNNYCIIKEPFSLFGKAVVEAHELEKDQNWGGIILSENLIKNIINEKHLLKDLVKYDDVPIKEKGLKNDYLKSPYVVKWMDKFYTPDWDWSKIIDKISNYEIALKVLNTMKFYYKYSNLYLAREKTKSNTLEKSQDKPKRPVET